jgi:hypothetical protein
MYAQMKLEALTDGGWHPNQRNIAAEDGESAARGQEQGVGGHVLMTDESINVDDVEDDGTREFRRVHVFLCVLFSVLVLPGVSLTVYDFCVSAGKLSVCHELFHVCYFVCLQTKTRLIA